MTKIEWTHVPDGNGGFKRGETWNPQVGCREVSPACRHCYAATTAHLHAKTIAQHRGLTVVRENGVHWNGKINRVPALQEERNKRWTRATAALQAGGITVHEFCAEVGFGRFLEAARKALTV
jgi:protein gp37